MATGAVKLDLNKEMKSAASPKTAERKRGLLGQRTRSPERTREEPTVQSKSRTCQVARLKLLFYVEVLEVVKFKFCPSLTQDPKPMGIPSCFIISTMGSA
eukprot:CAMPEP_0194781948 /NCGR_PEP_ID=MMETSP0323_2-20130528/77696_1 /TAXON_ID=2866 ORGANISM="Crypthecodinium cohnii, Strain Seligo" /NCGR_SAMPLE_ID=MMETSP0323_2 /ASSEMBLY_ACC=CAM_ASM_000346 /LENGTH=99 /DNA_ID=CAMNT_0039720593 /DNA_START=136 /DNA_END=431 /DNA_ORIENTATION=-